MESLVITTFLLLIGLLTSLEAAKILAIFPFPGPSQYILVEPYLKRLAGRGHEVTVVTAYPKNASIPNFREISAASVLKLQDDMMDYLLVEQNKWQELNLFVKMGENITLNVLDNPEMQELIKKKTHFDLVIIETLLDEALYGLGEHFGAHMIGVSSFGTTGHIDDLVGNPSPPSYIPHVMLGFTDRMDFYQRLKNFIENLFQFVHLHVVNLPAQEKIYREYFPDARLSLAEARKEFSLVLLNQHFSLSFPRPYVPNMVEVGGMHLTPAKGIHALPEDMQRFLNGSGDTGVIYFSMGSNIKSKDLPKDRLEVLMKTFASLEQRVMWKFEDPELPGRPDNVFISKWFPQPEILAHPKVKLFITHGGLLSTIEAIYHAKPILGIPMFYDQFLNVRRATRAGFGLAVDFKQMTETELRAKILQILGDASFTRKAEQMSRTYHDQTQTPLEKAIYWTEYVLRHKGARHMRSAALDLSFVQYHSLDTIGVLLGGLALGLLLLAWVLTKLLCLLLGRKNIGQTKKKEKSN